MIKLYKNFTPNYDYMYYYYDDITKYSNWLTTNQSLFSSFTEDSYRIENDKLIVAFNSTTMPEAVIKTITYIEYLKDNHYKYFLVRSFKILVGKIIFELEEDVFANYIAQAEFNNIHVLKSTRNIGEGILDDIKLEHNNTRYVLGLEAFRNWTDWALIAAIDYEIPDTNIFSRSSTIGMIGIDLTSDGLMAAINKVARAYEYTLVGQTSLFNRLKLGIINMWVVPKTWINKNEDDVWDINTYGSITARDTFIAYSVLPKIDNYVIDLNPSLAFKTERKMYIGTLNNYIEHPRTTTNDNKAAVQYCFDKDGFTAILQDNGKMVDITSAFNITASINEGNITTLQAIKKVIGGLNIDIDNKVKTAKSFITTGMSLTPEYKPRLIGGGDAAAVLGTGSNPNCFFNLIFYTANSNEKRKLECYGANFDVFVDRITSIFNNQYLLGATKTYIQAEVELNKIPLYAIEKIKTAFCSGIYLQYIAS